MRKQKRVVVNPLPTSWSAEYNGFLSVVVPDFLSVLNWGGKDLFNQEIPLLYSRTTSRWETIETIPREGTTHYFPVLASKHARLERITRYFVTVANAIKQQDFSLMAKMGFALTQINQIQQLDQAATIRCSTAFLRQNINSVVMPALHLWKNAAAEIWEHQTIDGIEREIRNLRNNQKIEAKFKAVGERALEAVKKDFVHPNPYVGESTLNNDRDLVIRACNFFKYQIFN